MDLSRARFDSSYPLPGSTGKNPRLTFGVEFEFALAALRDICKNPAPRDGRKVYGLMRSPNSLPLKHDPRPASFGDASLEERAYRTETRRHVYRDIVQTLKCCGFPAIHVQDDDYQMDGFKADMLDKWVVGTDMSIDCPDEKVYDWHRIEIKSPVFYMSEAALSDVARVWELMTTTYKVIVNESMGLHVHVGNGISSFDGETLRNLWAILWTTEKWIDTIHPPHRRENKYCPSFHRCSNLIRMVPDQENLENIEGDVLEWILTRTSPTVEMFLDTLCLHSGAYNFVNLQSYYHIGSVKRTIEFRQHEGTLDTERVKQWVQVCVGLVKASAAANSTILDPYLRQLVGTKREKLRIGDILSELGLKTSGVYYRAQVPRERVPVRIVVKKLWKKTTRFVKG